MSNYGIAIQELDPCLEASFSDQSPGGTDNGTETAPDDITPQVLACWFCFFLAGFFFVGFFAWSVKFSP